MVRTKSSGFTIVELLIVIVVIAILAAISFVTYTNIQARASNAAVINTAQQTIKLVKAYTATYGRYPVYNVANCLTVDNQCTNYVGDVVATDNTTILTELRKIGQPAESIPRAVSDQYGIYYDYYSPRTYNHDAVPVLIMYNLSGSNQDCKLENIVKTDPAPLPGESNAFIASQTGYTGSTGGHTRCWVAVDL